MAGITATSDLKPAEKMTPGDLREPRVRAFDVWCDPLLFLLHTKTATPLQYEKLSPPFANTVRYETLSTPSLFPQGGAISRESRYHSNNSAHRVLYSAVLHTFFSSTQPSPHIPPAKHTQYTKTTLPFFFSFFGKKKREQQNGGGTVPQL